MQLGVDKDFPAHKLIDKAKVKEAIHKVLTNDDWRNITDSLEDDLLKELGLNE